MSIVQTIGVLALLAAQAPAPGSDGVVSVEVSKYNGLADAVRKHRGQVVVVEFWAKW